MFPRAVSAFCDGVLRALRLSPCRIAVVIVSASRMREINRQYRSRDYPTDVLSFRYPGEMVEGLPFLGEIVAAPEIAWPRGGRWRRGPERELRKLLVHGILHLLDYDHETDRGEMMRLQRRLLRRRVFLQGSPLARRRAEP